MRRAYSHIKSSMTIGYATIKNIGQGHTRISICSRLPAHVFIQGLILKSHFKRLIIHFYFMVYSSYYKDTYKSRNYRQTNQSESMGYWFSRFMITGTVECEHTSLLIANCNGIVHLNLDATPQKQFPTLINSYFQNQANVDV